jgi:aspartate 1-decarboxylase
MKQIIAIFALVLLASACKKDETFEGSITIDAPSVNAQLQADSTITIQGSANGNLELHGYVLQVTRLMNMHMVNQLQSVKHLHMD